MKDKNGNYFCSDLFEVCDQSQRIKILKEIKVTFDKNNIKIPYTQIEVHNAK